MSLLYYQILRIQKEHPFFNKFPLSSGDMFKWAELLEIYLMPSVKISYAKTITLDGDKAIVYNPRLPEFELTLSLAHDIGHHLLGQNGSRKERDASVVGCLSLIPTSHLIRLAAQGRLLPEELHSDLYHLWPDSQAEQTFRLCVERIRIFYDLLKICGGKCLKGNPCVCCGLF